ncbi:MAG: Ig-like domain-containing protein [Patescibacteria group bacterium]
MPVASAQAVTSLERSIAIGSDDAEEIVSTGAVFLTSSDLQLTTDGATPQVVGMRFADVMIPQGTAIASAYIEFTVDETANVDPVALTIQADDADTSATFISVARNVSLRARTAAAVSWTPAPWLLIGAKQRTPDLSSIVQEVINRTGWAPGNAVTIIVTGSGRRVADSYEGVGVRPLLHVEYAGVGANNPPVLTPIGPKSVSEGQLLSFAISGTDPDGNALTYSATGLPQGATFNSSTLIFSWTPTLTQAGTYNVTFAVSDGSLTDSEVVVVTIADTDATPPSVSLSAPVDGATISGASVAVAANASDNTGVMGVQFWISGPTFSLVPFGAEDAAAPYGLIWDTTAGVDGAYTLLAVARDAAGNHATSTPIAATVQNIIPPQCSDGRDNDGDGLIDLLDPGCANASDNDEINVIIAPPPPPPPPPPSPQCADGFDNDGDDLIDYPADPGCASAIDADEINLPASAVTFPVSSGKFRIGDRVRVETGDGSRLNVRSGAGGALIGQQNDGALGTVIGSSQYVNGVFWWNIDFDIAPDGWGAEDFLILFVPTADVIAPTVAIVAPAGGTTVAGVVDITAQASDNIGVASVRFFVDGFWIGEEDVIAPYITVWNTTAVADGNHTITAIARDAAENVSGTLPISVSVKNAAGVSTVLSVSPAVGSVLPLIAAFSWNDIPGSARYQIYLGSAPGAFDIANQATQKKTTATVSGIPQDGRALYVRIWYQMDQWRYSDFIYRAGGIAGIETLCADGADNDADGLIDVQDPDCPATSAFSLDARVASGSDDAEEIVASGAMKIVDPTLDFFRDQGNDQIIGIRFPFAAIPRGVAITDAYLSLTAGKNDSQNTAMTIAADDADTAAAFAATAQNISLRQRTSASISWLPGAWRTGLGYRSPDLSAIIQEVVDRPGWTPGNSLALLANGSGSRTAFAYESSAMQAPTLHVGYRDSMRPTIALTTPQSGVTVAGVVPLVASVSDNVGIAGVKFFADGILWGVADSAAPYEASWDTTAISDGSHTLMAVAADTSNNTATSADLVVIVDNTAPWRLSGVPSGVLPKTARAATLALMTDEAATCRYDTRVNTPYGQMAHEFSGAFGTTTQTATISGLSEGGSYFYFVRCVDRYGNINADDWNIAFSIAANQPPQLNTIGPKTIPENQLLTFTLSATDPDGQTLTYSATNLPTGASFIPFTRIFSFTPSFTQAGVYTATFSVSDGALTDEETIAITVTDVVFDTTAPSIFIIDPLNNSIASSTTTVIASASDNVAVAGVQFYINNVPFGTEYRAPPYQTLWNTTAVSDGTSTIFAVARDAAGNRATSTVVSVRVDNTNPPQQCSDILDNDSDGFIDYPADPGCMSPSDTDEFNLTPQTLILEDDDFKDIIFTSGFTFPFYGLTRTHIFVNSNGRLTFNAGDTGYVESTAELNEQPQIALLFVDLSPDATGTMRYTQFPDKFVIDWNGIPEYPGDATSGSNTFSATLYNNGRIELVYSGITAKNGIVGIAPGGSPTLTPVNFSATPTFSTTGVVPIFEQFTATSPFDLRNSTLAFTPNGSGGFDVVGTFPPDLVPPAVSVTYPLPGVSVFGTTKLTAYAADDFAVAGVKFFIDGAQVGREDTSTPSYSIALNTSVIADGTHTVLAVARDEAGNTATSASVVFTVSNAVPPSSLTQGLIGYWPMSEGNGTSTTDTSGAGNIGTLTGGTAWTPGKIGNGVSFDGVDDYVSIGAPEEYAALEAYTLSAWVRPTRELEGFSGSLPIDGIAGDFDTLSGSLPSLYLTQSTNRDISCAPGPIRGGEFGSTLPAANGINWIHVVCSWDGATQRLFANGVQIASQPYTTPPANTPRLFSIGEVGRLSAKAGYFQGAIDDVRIYNRALSPTEILDLYVAAFAGDTEPPFISVIAPINNSAVFGILTVSASATDNSGTVSRVQFYVNGLLFGQGLTASPYNLSWDTTTGGDGAYTITAVAQDLVGNIATSTPILITVNNIITPVSSANLIAHWTFDDATGTVALDSVSPNNNGMLVNGPVWTTGLRGGGLYFDGTDDVVRIAGSRIAGHPLDLTAGPFTIMAWVKPKNICGILCSLSYGTIIAKQDGDADQYDLYSTSTPGGRRFDFRAGGEWGRASTTDAGGWRLVAVTVDDSGTPNLHVNGVQAPWNDAMGTRPFSFTHRDTDVSIGASWAGDPAISAPFRGVIDDVQVFKRALSAEELAEQYAFDSFDFSLTTEIPWPSWGDQGAAVLKGRASTAWNIAYVTKISSAPGASLPVEVRVSNLPLGVTYSADVANCTPQPIAANGTKCSIALAFSVPANLSEGIYPIVVEGTASNGVRHETKFLLMVKQDNPQYVKGDRVATGPTSVGPIVVYAAPLSTILGNQTPNGSVQGTIVDGPFWKNIDGIGYGAYYKVDFDSGPDGWVKNWQLVYAGLTFTAPPAVALPGVGYVHALQFTASSSNKIPVAAKLTQGPPGMTIAGLTVRWTPLSADAGKTYIVKFNATTTDNILSTHQFSVTVQAPTLLASQFISAATGGTITVSATGSCLNGATLTIPAGVFQSDQTVQIATLPASYETQIAGGLGTSLIPPFIILPTATTSDALELSIPIANNCALPQGTTLENVLLESVDAGGTGPGIHPSDDSGKASWGSIFSWTSDDNISVKAKVGPAIPIHVRSVPQGALKYVTSTGDLNPFSAATCGEIICMYYFRDDAAVPPSTAFVTFYNTLLTARDTTMQYVPMPGTVEKPIIVILARTNELRTLGNRMLRLNRNVVTVSAAIMQSVAAHELFHLGQLDLMGCKAFWIDRFTFEECWGHDTNYWMVESTAVLNEEAVFDSANVWKTEPAGRVWDARLTTLPIESRYMAADIQPPYQRMSFFKQLATRYAQSEGDLLKELWLIHTRPIYNKPFWRSHGALQTLDIYLSTKRSKPLGEREVAGELLDYVYNYNVARSDALMEEISTVPIDFSIPEPQPLNDDDPTVTLMSGEAVAPLSGRSFIVDPSECAGKDVDVESSGGALGHVVVMNQGDPYPNPNTIPPNRYFSQASNNIQLGNVAGKRLVVSAVNPNFSGVQNYTVKLISHAECPLPVDPTGTTTPRSAFTESAYTSVAVRRSQGNDLVGSESFNGNPVNAIDSDANRISSGSASIFRVTGRAWGSTTGIWRPDGDSRMNTKFIVDGSRAVNIRLTVSVPRLYVPQLGTSVFDQAVVALNSDYSVSTSDGAGRSGTGYLEAHKPPYESAFRTATGDLSGLENGGTKSWTVSLPACACTMRTITVGMHIATVAMDLMGQPDAEGVIEFSAQMTTQ